MNPMEVSDDVQAKLEAILDAEEEQPEEVVDGADEQTEEVEAEADSEEEQTEETEDEEQDSGDTETIELNGRAYEVKKEVASELETFKRNILADHTRKTQEAAETRKTAQQFYEQAKQQLDFRAQTLDLEAQYHAVAQQLKGYENVDWAELAEQDISTYSKHKEIRDGYREKAQQIAYELQQRQGALAQQAQTEHKQRYQWAVETVRKAIPDYNEQTDQRAVQAAIQLGEKYGIKVDPAYLQTQLDPLIWIGLTELAKYQDLQAKRPEVAKKVAAAPKFGKPTGKSQRNHQAQELKNKLRETGREEYAAKLIENML